MDENRLNKTQLLLHPNPAEDVLHIELCEQVINRITVYDDSGKEVYVAANLSILQFDLNTVAFDSGIYFITVQTPHGTLNSKFAVK